MKKSGVMQFGSYNNVNDEYITSSSSESLSDAEYPFESAFTKSQQFVVDLSPLITEQNLNMSPCIDSLSGYSAYDYDADPSRIETIYPLGSTVEIEPFNTVLYHTIHLEQFPPASTKFSKKLPCCYAGFNALVSYSSEFPSLLATFFKSAYSTLSSRLKFIPLIAPKKERFSSMNSTRNESQTNRIVYHYIGYGFPNVKENTLWCAESIRLFLPIELSTLFKDLQPPVFFIFDCNNAEILIQSLEKTVKELKESKNMDANWDDWICMCTTSVREEIPKDHTLPRDILTQILFYPLKMSFHFHILQKYRLSYVDDNFPLEIPFKNLWDHTTPNGKLLKNALTAITDAIACDGIPKEIYRKYYRTDTATAALFRNFLLAQFLLAPYRIHPKSHPNLPDLSNHKLWRHWTYLIDNAINPGSRTIEEIVHQFFDRLISFTLELINANSYDNIRPYHIAILFHALIVYPEDNRLIEIIPKIARNTLNDYDGFTSAALFPQIVKRFSEQEIGSPTFHSLLYTIAVLLHHNSRLENETRRDSDLGCLTNVIFDKEINIETRILATAVVAILVPTYEKFLKDCNEYEFLEQVCIELRTANAEMALWLLLLIRRTFTLYSPSPPAFVSIGLHVQVAAFIFNKDPALRCFAGAVLCTFLQPFESSINAQLLYLALPLAHDISFFCRFFLLQIVKKFLLSLNGIPAIQKTYSPQCLIDVVGMFFKNGTAPREPIAYLEAVDEELRDPNFNDLITDRCRSFVTFLEKDPIQEIADMAKAITSYIAHRDSTDSDSDMENFNINYGDFSEAITYGEDEYGELLKLGTEESNKLYGAAIKVLITIHSYEIKDENFNDRVVVFPQKPFEIPQKPVFRLKPYSAPMKLNLPQGLNGAAFNPKNSAFAVAAGTEIIHVDETRGIRTVKTIGDVTGFGFRCLLNRPMTIYATQNGCVAVQPIDKESPRVAFRAAAECDGLMLALFGDYVMCVSQRGTEVIFSLPQMQIVQEWKMEQRAIAVFGDKREFAFVGYEDGSILEKHPDGEEKIIRGPTKIPVVAIGSLENGDIVVLDATGLVDVIAKNPEDRVLSLRLEPGIVSFAVLPRTRLLAVSNDSRSPAVIDLNGRVVFSTRQPPGSRVFAHPRLPLVGFVSPNGEVTVYRIDCGAK